MVERCPPRACPDQFMQTKATSTECSTSMLPRGHRRPVRRWPSGQADSTGIPRAYQTPYPSPPATQRPRQRGPAVRVPWSHGPWVLPTGRLARKKKEHLLGRHSGREGRACLAGRTNKAELSSHGLFDREQRGIEVSFDFGMRSPRCYSGFQSQRSLSAVQGAPPSGSSVLLTWHCYSNVASLRTSGSDFGLVTFLFTFSYQINKTFFIYMLHSFAGKKRSQNTF